MEIDKVSSLFGEATEAIPQKILSALQGLRGISILAIILSHYPFIKNHAGENVLGGLGGLGVELFILLSGYLFFYWNWAEPVHVFSWREKLLHAVRKCRKYYWLHIGTLLFALPFWGISMIRHPSWGTGLSLPLNAFLLQSFFPWSSIYFSMNWVSWYLSVTIFFLFASWDILAIMKGITFRQTIYVMLGIVVIECLWPVIVSEWDMVQGRVHWIVYICPFVRVFDFVLGGGTFILTERLYPQVSWRVRCWLFVISVVMYGTMLWLRLFTLEAVAREIFSVAAWTIPSILLLFALVCGMRSGERNFFFENRFLVFVGDISFELFMVHQLVERYVMTVYHKLSLGIGEAVPLGVAFVLSVFIAWWLHRHAGLFIWKSSGE